MTGQIDGNILDRRFYIVGTQLICAQINILQQRDRSAGLCRIDGFLKGLVLVRADCSNGGRSRLDLVKDRKRPVSSLLLNLYGLTGGFSDFSGLDPIEVGVCRLINRKPLDLIRTGDGYLVSLRAVLYVEERLVFLCGGDSNVVDLYRLGLIACVTLFNIYIDRLIALPTHSKVQLLKTTFLAPYVQRL